MILCICTGIESVNDDQALNSNDKKEDRVELGDVLPQEIWKDQEITYGKDCILIATVSLYMLCYARN